MKALKDLTKDELLTFIYNYPPGDINIFEKFAVCFSCAEGLNEESVKYYYECEDCQNRNADNQQLTELNL